MGFASHTSRLVFRQFACLSVRRSLHVSPPLQQQSSIIKSAWKQPFTFRTATIVGSFSLGIAGVTLANAGTSDKEEHASGQRETEPPLTSLVRSYVVYSLCSVPPIVTYSPAILAFVSSIPGLKQLAEIVVRVTFFNQFVGGETAEDTIPLLETLRARNKGVLFAYSVEVDEHAGSSGATAQYRKNVEEMIHSIDVAADFEDRHALSTVQGLSGRKTWVALKLTALVPSADALAHFSEYLLKTRPSDGLVHYPGTPHSTDLDILSQSNPPPNSSITAEDFEALRTLKDDLERICRRAKDRNVKVIIDAEHTWCQPAIDAFQLSLTREFNSFRSSNRASEPTVYGTYQAYLRRNTMHLLRSLEDAQREGYALGVKLVRGAYHSQEHKHISPYEPANVSLAQSRIKEAGSGFPQHQQGPRPPVWDEKWETDAAYNAAAALMLDLLRRPNSSIGVLFGTHNKESCDLIIMGLVARGLANPIDRSGSDNESQRFWVNNQIVNRISFGQLYGMCDALTDHLTNSLEASSPVVLKYVPYGALRDVMPYLGRRAVENQSVLGAKEGGAADERRRAGQLIWKRIFG